MGPWRRVGNGCSQRPRRRRGDGDRNRGRLRTAQRAVLHHSERVRRRLRLRLRLQQRPRARPDGCRLHCARRLSARSRAADSLAASQPVYAGPRRPAQCLCRRRRRHVQSRRRRSAVAGLFAQSRDRKGRRHRSRDVLGHRQPSRYAESGAHRSVVGSPDALGFGGRERARRPWRGRADRSTDRQGRQSCRRPRFVQHLLHARRQIGDRRRRGDAAARVPRPAHDGAAGLRFHAPVRRDKPRRFFARRQLRDLHLRVQRFPRQDRSRPSHAG